MIFQTAGTLNETIEVVAHLLQRAEMRPILEHLDYSQASTAIDSNMVSSLAAFIEGHLSSCGTRTTETQAAHELLLKAVSSQELIDDKMVAEAARRLRVRAATMRHLIDCRVTRYCLRNVIPTAETPLASTAGIKALVYLMC